jgi:hypothetical protein
MVPEGRPDACDVGCGAHGQVVSAEAIVGWHREHGAVHLHAARAVEEAWVDKALLKPRGGSCGRRAMTKAWSETPTTPLLPRT